MKKKVLGCVNSETDELNEIDREYIKKIRLGDDYALNEIMEKYKNFVYLKAKPFFIVGAEKEDIIQVVRVFRRFLASEKESIRLCTL